MEDNDRLAAQRMSEAADRAPGGIRDHYNRFIARHAVAWELTFAILALVFVVLPLVPRSVLSDEMERNLEVVLTGIFAVEFFSRLLAARNPRVHLRHHWIDAVALIPPIRALRILRLLRLVRAFSGFYRAGMALKPVARHRGFLSLVAVWVGLGVLCSVAFYAAETEAQPRVVDDPFDAIWWGVGSLSTVGSDLFPITMEGRIAAIALMVVGVFLFSAITATITSVLLANSGTDETSERIGLSRELARLADLHERGMIDDGEFHRSKQLAMESVAAALRRESAA